MVHRLSHIAAIGLIGLVASLAWGQPYFKPGQDPKSDGKIWTSVPALTDDFNGTALDHKKWQDEPVGNGWMWDGRPPALFKASNVVVKDGKMQITVGKLDKPVVRHGHTYTHQGAIVRAHQPGQVGWYYECRMKANQTVMSSTFWLITKGKTKKKLELDIQECVGRTSDKTEKWGKNWDHVFHSNTIYRTNRYNKKKVQQQGAKPLEVKNSDRFYVYGAWWKSPREIRFYLDGVYAYSIHPEVDWDVPSYIQMAVETYDWNPLFDDGGLVEKGTSQQRTTQYDWVRVWKLEDKPQK